jgi:alpha-D-ribose 1-methylphosphonate 5-triphosphate synthase subunit PhnG
MICSRNPRIPHQSSHNEREPMSSPTIPARISSELNQAEAADVIALASLCLRDDPDVTVTKTPRVGVVVTQVREPVAEQRFILGDLMACQAEVNRRGVYGWSTRLGSDTLAVLSAAILAAEFTADGPRRAEIEELVDRTERTRAAQRAAEWERLTPSIVEFEEIP